MAGCAGTDDTDHTMHGPPSPDMMLQGALHHLDLTDAQRAAIEAAAHAVPPAPAMDPAEAVAGIRAGKLDEAALLAHAGGDRTAALATALATLHATLTPEQRRALVDAAGQHLSAHHGDMLAMLDLTPAQRVAIDKIHPDLHAQLEAFASDRFDAAAFVAPMTMQAHVHALAAILPILEPAQRDALAAAIETMHH